MKRDHNESYQLPRERLFKNALAKAAGALELGGYHRFQLLNHVQPPLHFRHDPRLCDKGSFARKNDVHNSAGFTTKSSLVQSSDSTRQPAHSAASAARLNDCASLQTFTCLASSHVFRFSNWWKAQQARWASSL